MKYRFMYEHRREYRISKMAETLATSQSSYYAWKRQGCQSKRALRDAQYLATVKKAFVEMRETYGPRRLSKHLCQGIRIGRVRLERMMRENNLAPKTIRKFIATTKSNHDYPVAPNILNRNFTVAAKNMAWITDITYVATQEGWLHLAAVMELCSGKIVGWAMDKQMTASLVCDALKQAIGRAKPPGDVICHSDRGVQYACHTLIVRC